MAVIHIVFVVVICISVIAVTWIVTHAILSNSREERAVRERKEEREEQREILDRAARYDR